MKAHIHHLYPKDETFFKVLSIAGNIRNEDANNINISNSRLKNFEKDKLIERVSYPSRNNSKTQSEKCYALTKKGKEFVANQFGIKRCQSGYAAEHNCKVAETICSLNKEEIASVQSEWESRNQLEEMLEQMRQDKDDRYDEYMEKYLQGKISAPDIIYKSSVTQEVVGIEIITGNYKDDDIEAKEIFGEVMHVEIELVNA